MELFTAEQRKKLLANGKVNAAHVERDGNTEDMWPVVKLFCPWMGATWLISELDPADEDLAFGLCDLGMGCPEIGNVRISELAAVRGPGGLTIERDIHFRAAKSLVSYANEAHSLGHINA